MRKLQAAALLALALSLSACSDPTAPEPDPEHCWRVTEYNMETGERRDYEYTGTELPEWEGPWPWARFAIPGCEGNE